MPNCSPLTAKALTSFHRVAARAVPGCPQGLTVHSLHRGAAQACQLSALPIQALIQAETWHSEAFWEYLSSDVVWDAPSALVSLLVSAVPVWLFTTKLPLDQEPSHDQQHSTDKDSSPASVQALDTHYSADYFLNKHSLLYSCVLISEWSELKQNLNNPLIDDRIAPRLLKKMVYFCSSYDSVTWWCRQWIKKYDTSPFENFLWKPSCCSFLRKKFYQSLNFSTI